MIANKSVSKEKTFHVTRSHVCAGLISLMLLLNSESLLAQSQTDANSGAKNDAELMEQFIKTKGEKGVIVFDASNIKQFWINNSVVAKDGFVSISLQRNKNDVWGSVPLKIQLANVDESLDCRIDILSETEDNSFSVLNSKSKQISESSKGEDFIRYHNAFSTIHLEDIKDFSFYLQFRNQKTNQLPIKKIILSFYSNKESNYLSSPGILKISQNDITLSRGEFEETDTFALKGKQIHFLTKKNIIPSNDKEITTSLTIKNISDTSTKIYIGFAVYSKEGKVINRGAFPYKNNKPLKVLSSEKGSNIIVVDGDPEWAENCILAINNEDGSFPVPSFTFVNGKIVKVEKNSSNQTEITMSEPLKNDIRKDAMVRVHNLSGGTLSPIIQNLAPGKEEKFTVTLKEDDKLLEFTQTAFPHGTYYVKPLIFSNSTDASKENSIVVKDYIVSF